MNFKMVEFLYSPLENSTARITISFSNDSTGNTELPIWKNNDLDYTFWLVEMLATRCLFSFIDLVWDLVNTYIYSLD